MALFPDEYGLKLPFNKAMRGRIGLQIAARCAPLILRNSMSDEPEPKSAAELREIRVNRKLAQDAEGLKAMADIAAADIAIRKRTANLRAARLAREAADRDKPAEHKAKASPRKKKTI